MDTWGDPTVDPNLLVPVWDEVTKGMKVSVVISDLCWSSDIALGCSQPDGKMLRVIGLPCECRSHTKVTLLDAIADVGTAFLDLIVTDETCVVLHTSPSCVQVLDFVEFCSGLGASASGLVQAGFRHRCSVEWNQAIATLHERLHKQVPVIVGDIADVGLLKSVQEICKPPFTLAAGFSCQPFSQGGSQAGQDDARAASLPALVRAAHLLQCPMIIGECVTPACSNAYVRAHLDLLRTVLDFRVSEVCLRLEDVWASKRFRWWFVAAKSSLGTVPLSQMPGNSPLVVRDLMPFVKSWPLEDMTQLCLTEDELKAFQREDKRLQKFVVQLDAKMPTALHSWGCQCVPCQCGCRQGFNDARLLARGIYAQIVAVASELGLSPFRHMHAMEVSLLNGFLPLQDWGPNQRLNLSAIGQLGSPLQAVWVGACIRQHLNHMSGDVAVEPLEFLHQAKAALFAQSKVLYPSLSVCPGPSLTAEVQFENEPGVRVVVDAATTVADILDAEAKLGRPSCDWLVLQVPDDMTLALTDTVAGRCLCFTHPCAPTQLCLDLPQAPLDELAEVQDLPCEPHASEVHTVPEDDVGSEVKTIRELLAVTDTERSDVLHSYLKLSQGNLAAMVPPLVADNNMCLALRHQLASAVVRKQLLMNQGFLWGDDEMLWAMNELHQQTQKTGVVILDPLIAQTWMRSCTVDTVKQALADFGEIHMLFTVVHVDAHWIPVAWTARGHTLEVAIWEHDETAIDPLSALHGKLVAALGFTHYTVACTRRNFGEQMCGAAAIAYAAHRLCGHMLPANLHELEAFHHVHKQHFAAFLDDIALVARPWCWGSGNADTQQLVATLLQFHGVPSGQTQQRARLVIQSLGKDAVHGAVLGVSPWRSLKALANQHKPPVQLVLQDEQAAAHAAKGPKQKGRKAPALHKTMPSRPTEIDPDMLILEDGMFRFGNDEPLVQLKLAHLGPLSTGVAIATHAEAMPFLKSGALLTSKALAILVINHQQELQTTLQWSTLRFAARCALNQEPMLLNGVLVQLGKTPVHQFQGVAHHVSLPAEVACARITVFADQWDGPWDEFCSRPVKLLLMKLPMLLTCRNPKDTCQCKGWHPHTAQDPDAVLDVFRRHFYNDNNKPVKAEKASSFSVFLRFAKCLEPQVLSCSGIGGLYVEPKTEDAMQPHGDYQVVWLPQMSFDAIAHKARCDVKYLGLARTGQRYGVRVKAKDFQAAFTALKPDGLFLEPGQRTTYHCGPWPFGLDRKSLAKILKDWGWTARPLQPMQSVPGGLMWAVQAVVGPPSNVVAMPHGQVVVSCASSAASSSGPVAAVVGQSNTVQLCAVKDTKSLTDPWLRDDPWRMAVQSVKSPEPAAIQPDALDELEKRIEKSVLARIPAQVEPMEVDDQEGRLQQLESQMQQLAQRHTQLEQTVAENHMQSTAQAQSLQQQMMSQLDMQSKQLQSMLTDQMLKIETILAKKPRTE